MIRRRHLLAQISLNFRAGMVHGRADDGLGLANHKGTLKHVRPPCMLSVPGV